MDGSSERQQGGGMGATKQLGVEQGRKHMETMKRARIGVDGGAKGDKRLITSNQCSNEGVQ